MMTLKDLLTSGAQTSPDGEHWEPSIPLLLDWNWRDAWAVLRGRALAVRQTVKADLPASDDDWEADATCPLCKEPVSDSPDQDFLVGRTQTQCGACWCTVVVTRRPDGKLKTAWVREHR